MPWAKIAFDDVKVRATNTAGPNANKYLACLQRPQLALFDVQAVIRDRSRRVQYGGRFHHAVRSVTFHGCDGRSGSSRGLALSAHLVKIVPPEGGSKRRPR